MVLVIILDSALKGYDFSSSEANDIAIIGASWLFALYMTTHMDKFGLEDSSLENQLCNNHPTI